MFGEAVQEGLILSVWGRRQGQGGGSSHLGDKIIEVMSHTADHTQKASTQALGRHRACLRRREIGVLSPGSTLKLIINLVWMYVLVIPG